MAKKGRGLLKSNSDGDVGMKTNNKLLYSEKGRYI